MSQYPATWDSVIIDAQTQGQHFYLDGNSNSSNSSGSSKTSSDKSKLVGLSLINGFFEGGGSNHPRGGSVTVINGHSLTFEKILFKNNVMKNNGETHSAGAVRIEATTISSKFYNCRFENLSLIHI